MAGKIINPGTYNANPHVFCTTNPREFEKFASLLGFLN